jgi:hypothetical protein
MAQIMKYWEWPVQGTGEHSYVAMGYGEQYANFGATTYDWDNMIDNYNYGSTQEQKVAVATLMYHCGVSVDMMYEPSGSGAFSPDVPVAISNYFSYSDHATYLGRSGTYDNWIALLKTYIDQHIPLYYSGQGEDGGHAFICDGYDEDDLFNFNYGWGGSGGGFLMIDGENFEFSGSQAIVYDFVPDYIYNQMPKAPENFSVSIDSDVSRIGHLSWTNPTLDLNGNELTSITSVTIRRNGEVIAELTEAQVGANMDYEDNGLQPGLYEYAIYVTNAAGISRTTYRTILVGEKCNIVFQMHDAGGDGWKGAAISVADENGNRIAVVTMTEGSSLAVDLPLLSGNLNFIWNHGWYHAYEENDTDSECSFSIVNAEGETIYTSTELEDGVFFSYDPCSVDAVEETTTSSSVNVYPNPTNGMLNVAGQGTMHISVMNVLGQTLQETCSEGNATLDLSQYESGMYLIRIETESGIEVQKVSIRK